MATQGPVQNSRQWDYIYDPTYTVSGQKDHQRQEMKAYTRPDRIRKNIKFNTMFSSLSHFPSYMVSLQKTDPIPPFIDRNWRNFPEASQAAKATIAPQVSGKNRYKYFRRPNIPALSSVAYQNTSEIKTVPGAQDTNQANVVNVGNLSQNVGVIAEAKKVSHAISDQQLNSLGMKSQQTQTDYRESEAQTDPYSPEWVLSADQNIQEAPEIITLMSLTYGAGLPAGPIEIEMIERARSRRKWEESLPPLSGEGADLDKRRRMMAEQEKKQWQWREQNLERLHRARLDLLATALNDRNELKEEQTEGRLQVLKNHQETEARIALERYRNDHIQAIRKLIKSSQKKMSNVPDPNKHNHGKRDIVADYADCGSSSWAPLNRVGVFPDRKSENNNISSNDNTSKYLNTLPGLVELERTLPKSVTDIALNTPIPPEVKNKSHLQHGFVPRALREQHELDQVYDMLKSQEEDKQKASNKGINANDLRLLKKIERPQPRPATPTRKVDEEQEEMEQNCLVVQRLIRGNAIQKQWKEGAGRRADLLAELRAVVALEDHEKEALKQREKALKLQQNNDQIKAQQKSAIDALVKEMVGQTIANKLDFVNKELIRLQEERRLHALSLLAERRRRLREAAESGLRQAEERRRREEDEIYKQLLKVHQDTVDQFLTDVIANANDRVADSESRKEIEKLADEVATAAEKADRAIRAAEKEGNMIKAQMLVSEICGEIVHDFMVPEVANMEQREDQAKVRKFRTQATKELLSEKLDELTPVEKEDN